VSPIVALTLCSNRVGPCPPACFGHNSVVGSQSPLHIHLNVGPLLFHLCLCALLRPHSIDSTLPPTPLTFAAYAGGQRAKEHILCMPPLQKVGPPSRFPFLFFPVILILFSLFSDVQREESQVQGSFKYDLHI